MSALDASLGVGGRGGMEKSCQNLLGPSPAYLLYVSLPKYSYKDSPKQLTQQRPALGQESKLRAGGLESGFTNGV